MNELRMVSLFSGAGGLDMGFVRAGFTPTYSTDIDVDSMDTYDEWLKDIMWHRFPFVKHVSETGDISHLQHMPDSADIVIGGPPCQGFSVAGRMDPLDPRSKHVWDFLRVIRDLDPRVFVMENVQSLASGGRWERVRGQLLAEVQKLGYTPRLHILNAADYGAPQSRVRMFLIGTKDVAPVDRTPLPVVNGPRTVREALRELPRYGEVGNDSFCPAKITAAKKPVLRKSPYAGMLFNGAGRPLNLDRPSLTIAASAGGNRTHIIDQEWLEGGQSWVERYHRQLTDGEQPCREVPSRLRRLTVEEAAALQTFPEGMHWHGKRSSQYRQVGNAVPPVLAYHVANIVKESLTGKYGQ